MFVLRDGSEAQACRSDFELEQPVGPDSGALRDIYRTTIHAGRRAIQKLRATDIVDATVNRQLFSELDLLEAALMFRPSARMLDP